MGQLAIGLGNKGPWAPIMINYKVFETEKLETNIIAFLDDRVNIKMIVSRQKNTRYR